MEQNIEGGLPAPAAVQRHESLSEREQEVLRYVALGYSNRDIAHHMSLSEHTVKSHLKSVFAKLQVRNRTEAAATGRHLQIVA